MDDKAAAAGSDIGEFNVGAGLKGLSGLSSSAVAVAGGIGGNTGIDINGDRALCAISREMVRLGITRTRIFLAAAGNGDVIGGETGDVFEKESKGDITYGGASGV